MKRRGSETDIKDWKQIRPAVADCITRHFRRYDFREFLEDFGISKNEYQIFRENGDYGMLDPAIDSIAKYCADKIRKRELVIDYPSLTERIDKTTGKVRQITCETPLHQVYDFIAIHAAMPVFKARLVAEQASGMKGRGQIYGVRVIKKIVDKDNAAVEYAIRHGQRYHQKCKYFVKIDIRKCFPSMRKDVFMSLFRNDCNNQDLIWLFDAILEYHKVKGYEGFLIGSLISQWAAQYVISFLYRYITTLRDKRGNRMVHRCVIWMDDILLISPNRKNLKKAVKDAEKYAENELKLTVKPNWQILEFTKNQPIDMMGFLVYRSGKIGIRPRNFIKSRRIALRAAHGISERQAKRLLSYKGFYKYSNSRKANDEYHMDATFAKAAKIISERSDNGKRIPEHEARGSYLHASSGQGECS